LVFGESGGGVEMNPMDIRMIVTDLDGTLLRSDKTVSRYTADVFRKCRDKRIKIVFATARPIRTVKSLHLDIENDAAIYHNGAVIWIAPSTQILHSIGPQLANDVIQAALDMDPTAQIFMECRDVATANFDASRLWKDIGFLRSDFSQPLTLPIDKINMRMENNEQVEAIKNILPNELYLVPTENRVGMIMDATKTKAITQVSGYFGIQQHHIAVFGDDYNDIDMLRECGVGVAVGNAIGEAKTAADYVCDS